MAEPVIRRALAIAVTALLLTLGLGAAAQPAQAANGTATATSTASLTDIGRGAIEDLRTCLSSSDVLNVYYLVDSSGSLNTGGDDGRGSDPDIARAGILAGSLQELGGLRDSLTVNWGAAFFSRAFEPAVDWRPWSQESPEALAGVIRDKTPGGGTNWLAGLQGVQSALESQPSAGSACQLVIWLTDGEIDLGSARATADATNALCGVRIDPAGDEPEGNGLLAALRQAGVVVLGTLLADGEQREEARVMWPLVEGSGAYGGGTATCGPAVAPEGSVRGAVVDASDPDALASVFLELGARIAGGASQALAADGSFWIDPGVARVQAVVKDGWTLQAPASSGLGTLSAATQAPEVTVTQSSGVSRLEITVDRPELQGQWTLTSPGTAEVFAFSDLRIVFDEANQVQRGEDGTLSATLTARVQDRAGESVDLSVFGEAAFSATSTADGATTPLSNAAIDAASGVITLPLPSDVTASELLVTASLEPLTTAEHAIELAPVTTQQRITTVLPAAFPSVASPLVLSELTGADGRAEGTLAIQGPTAGGDGQVCLSAAPTVTSDNADRADAWQWSFADESGAVLAPGACLDVAQGGSRTVTVSAENPVAADSSVAATLPLDVRTAGGSSAPQTVALSFPSTFPVNAAAIGLVALVLLLLGVLLPLLGLYLFNRAKAKIAMEGSFQRGTVPVEITPEGVRSALAHGRLDECFRYLRSETGVRELPDAELGRLRAHVPPWPLKAPSYRVGPPAGGVIVASRTGTRGTSAGRPLANGGVEFSALPLDVFWAIVVSEQELERPRGDAPVRATAVLYHRVDRDDEGQYDRRLEDVLRDSGEPAWHTVERLRRERAAKRPEQQQPARSEPAEQRSTVPPRSAGQGAGAPGSTPTATPPRPTSPPRPGGPPPRTQGAPGRPGGPPPPRPGGATPPPPPGRSGPRTPPPRGR
ncbi:hypothetical protein HQQ82_08465 [Rathayibacter sp. VKM Ac-2856]|uniref:hypothetical protein n=1 Tax=unclassified Rathayibacter TaxID=2609250 RepID=UPI0015662D87|nr:MULTISPECIES: hypothetical protein [unclassified Rathayibacter]NQX04833.1 hypothetical protein [Rathayibacter sp. VKM Ac-2858]NQX20001.1 hypothetical protein [Rathayibacter sp. VKM Ac-2856]